MHTIDDTQDGSNTLISSVYGEMYHSKYGALTESNHVFIDAGLKHMLSNNPMQLQVLEMGLGTGLNALLTYEALKDTNIHCHYVAFETIPVEKKTIDTLNYPEIIGVSPTLFTNLHDCSWEKDCALSDQFTFCKRKQSILELNESELFDLVYYDAFAPAAQPELWTEECFARIYKSMKPNATLVTYCAKGQVKRNLKAVGFTVEGIPGPPGKREMTRATK